VANVLVVTQYGSGKGLGATNSVQDHTLDAALLVLLFVHAFECLLKLHLMGSFRYYARRNLADFVIVSFAVVAAILSASINAHTNKGGEFSLQKTGLSAARFPAALVTLRVFTVFSVFKRMVHLIASVIAPFINVAGLLLVLFLFYGILGVQLYLGVFDETNADQTFNFNTLANALVLLFSMFMGEETNAVMWEAIRKNGRWKAVLYFTSFQVVTVWLMSNLFVGIVLDSVLRRITKEGTALARIGSRSKQKNRRRAKSLSDSASDSDGGEDTSMNGPNTMSRREVENELYGGTDDSRKTSIMMASSSSATLVQARERAAERAATANSRRKLKGAVKGVIAAQGIFGTAADVGQLTEHENPLHRGNVKGATAAERMAAGRTLSNAAMHGQLHAHSSESHL
jgi:hypothetical protein